MDSTNTVLINSSRGHWHRYFKALTALRNVLCVSKQRLPVGGLRQSLKLGKNWAFKPSFFCPNTFPMMIKSSALHIGTAPRKTTQLSNIAI
ncbi:hypothetical protein TcasGA2_TC013100 [Tribolium castaneum]|uniref:Uncharacterized protein n=1 Tax=Tribolium castaneum TaxID=7070 RepID=D6WP13_TRICA|nr:hypothetical protein TcasGA2_TC013100 [Tribolium castaneum]